MSGAFDAFSQGWTRSLLVLLVLIPVGIFTRSFKTPRRQDLHWWLIYAVPGSFVIPFYYYGFTHLSIGTATLIFYASLTVASYILGFAFFGEKMTWPKLISLLLGIGGLVIIYAKSINIDNTLGLPLLLTAVSGLCGGTEVVFTKKLSQHYSPLQLTTFVFIVSLVLCLILSFFVLGFPALPNHPIPWIGNVIHGIATTAAFFFVIMGFKRIEPSVGGIIGLTEILFGIVFGILVFGEVITPEIILGGACIVAAAALPNLSDLIVKIKMLHLNIT